MTKVPIHGFEHSIDAKGGNSSAFLPAWPDVGQEGKKTGEAQNLSTVIDQIMKTFYLPNDSTFQCVWFKD